MKVTDPTRPAPAQSLKGGHHPATKKETRRKLQRNDVNQQTCTLCGIITHNPSKTTAATPKPTVTSP